MRLNKIILLSILTIMLFSLVSCTGGHYSLSKDGLNLEVYLRKDKSINKIDIENADSVRQKWKLERNPHTAENSLEITDINFDGNPDIRICISEKPSEYFLNLIYDPDTKKYITNKRLDNLSHPVLDTAEKQITASYYEHTVEPAVGTDPETYIDEKGIKTYKWQNGRLSVIRKECTTYYSENEIYCIAVWELNDDGEPEPITEQWLTPEQYKSKGYEPFAESAK